MKLKGRKEKIKNTVKKAKINKNGVMKGISNGEHTPKYYDAYIKYPIIIINDNIKTADDFIFEVWDDFLDSLTRKNYKKHNYAYEYMGLNIGYFLNKTEIRGLSVNQLLYVLSNYINRNTNMGVVFSRIPGKDRINFLNSIKENIDNDSYYEDIDDVLDNSFSDYETYIEEFYGTPTGSESNHLVISCDNLTDCEEKILKAYKKEYQQNPVSLYDFFSKLEVHGLSAGEVFSIQKRMLFEANEDIILQYGTYESCWFYSLRQYLYKWLDKHAFEDSFEDYALMGIKRDIDRLPYYYDKTDENYHFYEETNEKYSDFVNHTYDEIRGKTENIEKANMLKEAKKIIEGGKAEQMLIKLGFIRGAMGANCIFYHNENDSKGLVFNISCKSVAAEDSYDSKDIDMNELTAINEMCKELGWI